MCSIIARFLLKLQLDLFEEIKTNIYAEHITILIFLRETFSLVILSLEILLIAHISLTFHEITVLIILFSFIFSVLH